MDNNTAIHLPVVPTYYMMVWIRERFQYTEGRLLLVVRDLFQVCTNVLQHLLGVYSTVWFFEQLKIKHAVGKSDAWKT